MKKILILGAAGMAGHIIAKYLKLYSRDYEVYTTARDNTYINANYYIDIEKDLEKLQNIISEEQFDIVVNCIGILMPDTNKNIARAIYTNSFFPHWLVGITKDTNTKIIHLSTDCVFSGKKGHYTEQDIPDETHYYGRSKSLGEINNSKDLTLRLSIIGTELKPNGSGLLHWFLTQTGEVRGYSKVYWNGITTLELAKHIHLIIQHSPNLSGLYHLAPDFTITKYELLKLANEVFNKGLKILESPVLSQNKILINNRRIDFNPYIQDYKTQLEELKNFIEK